MLNKVFTFLAEIQKLSQLRDSIDPKTDSFEKVIGSYFLSEEIRCSKKDCHQMHKTGAIVLLEGNWLSFIGHACAKKIFGERYEIAWDQHTEQVVLPQLKAELASFKTELPRLLHRVKQIKPSLIELVELRQKINQFYGLLWHMLYQRSASGNSRISYERERAHEEVSRLLATNSGLRASELKFETVTIGFLKGLSALESFDPVRELNIVGVGIESLERATPYTLPKNEVFSLHQWTRGVDSRLERLEKWVASAKLFFDEENLKLLAQHHATGALRSELQRFSLSALRGLELRAANESMETRSKTRVAKSTEVAPVEVKSSARVAAGMNAFRRLRNG